MVKNDFQSAVSAAGHIRCRLALWLCAVMLSLAARAAEPAITVERTAEFHGLCDASAGVALGNDRFVVACDEDNFLRIYSTGEAGMPLERISLNRFLTLKRKPKETDLEAAARVDDRIYWCSSHGRNRGGQVRALRQAFLCTAVVTNGTAVTVQPVGKPYWNLLEDLCAAPALRSCDLRKAATRAPKEAGALNIEGLAAMPDGRLLLGFRNPIPHGKALLVPLENPAEMVRGTRARLGAPIELDLGGNGIRDLAAWQDGYLILAGPYASEGAFALHYWRPKQGGLETLKGIDFGDLNPEAILVYPDPREGRVQLLSDDGTRKVGKCDCKALPNERQRSFRSLILRWP